MDERGCAARRERTAAAAARLFPAAAAVWADEFLVFQACGPGPAAARASHGDLWGVLGPHAERVQWAPPDERPEWVRVGLRGAHAAATAERRRLEPPPEELARAAREWQARLASARVIAAVQAAVMDSVRRPPRGRPPSPPGRGPPS